VVPPDDEEAISAALAELESRHRAGSLDGTALSAELKERLSRRARAAELAELLRSLE
jgi:glycosyltransferase involved in cell wall biosynthesis